MCFFCSWGTFRGKFVPGVAIFLGWGTFWLGFVPGVAISSCWGTFWPGFVPGVAISPSWGTLWRDFVPGVAISYARGTFRGRFVPGGSIPAEGLSFVCWYKSVAGNLFFQPAVFFPYRGDELARVVDPESHVCDRQSFLYVVGLVEGAD